MVFFWNAQLLLVTTDLVEQARLRIALRKAGIQYRMKLTRYSNDGKAAGLQGPIVDYSHEYSIYVRKQDFAHAKALCEANAHA